MFHDHIQREIDLVLRSLVDCEHRLKAVEERLVNVEHQPPAHHHDCGDDHVWVRHPEFRDDVCAICSTSKKMLDEVQELEQALATLHGADLPPEIMGAIVQVVDDSYRRKFEDSKMRLHSPRGNV